jgi:hypothetical protein
VNDVERQRMHRDGWSEESIECAAKFGAYAALIPVERNGGRVMTPKGPGLLVQAGRTCRVLRDRKKMRVTEDFDWRDVAPEGTEAARRMREER